MQLEQIKNYDWEKYWVGNWSFLTSCYFGHCYTKAIKRQMGEGFDKAIIVSRRGYTSCYFDKKERRKYGEFVGAKITKNKDSVLEFSLELKTRADNLVATIHKLGDGQKISANDYRKFIAEFMEYNGPHISVRHTIDFLSPNRQKEYIGIFQDLRLYRQRNEKAMHYWHQNCY